MSTQFSRLISVSMHHTLDDLNMDTTQDSIVLPIHAAPPEQRLRVFPPLLKQSLAGSDSSHSKKNETSRIPEEKPEYPNHRTIVVSVPKNIIKPKPTTVNAIPSLDTMISKLSARTQHRDTETRPKMKKERLPLDSNWTSQQLDYLYDELYALENLMEREKQKTMHVGRVQTLDSSILLNNQSGFDKNVHSPFTRSVSSSFEKSDEAFRKPLPYTTSTTFSTKSLNNLSIPDETLLTKIEMTPRLKNGPVETLLKQDGVWFENLIFPINHTKRKVNLDKRTITLKGNFTGILHSSPESKILSGSNIPFYSYENSESIQNHQLEAAKRFFKTDHGYTGVLSWPLSQMAPTQSIYRVNVTVHLSDTADPRPVFPPLSVFSFLHLQHYTRSSVKRPVFMIHHHYQGFTDVPVMMLQDSFFLIVSKFTDAELWYPNFHRTVQGDCENLGDVHLPLNVMMRKSLTKILCSPLKSVPIYAITENQSANLRLFKLENKTMENTFVIMKCYMTTSPIFSGMEVPLPMDLRSVSWRWKSKLRGIADLIEEESNATQETQDEYTSQNKNEDSAKESNGVMPSNEHHDNLNETIEKILQKEESKGARDVAKSQNTQKNEHILTLVVSVWLKKDNVFETIRDRVLSRYLVSRNNIEAYLSQWDKLSDGTCLPPLDYSGVCNSISLKNFTDSMKEKFALSCSAEWPCLDTPPSNFTSICPIRWENPGSSLCIAPNDYDGLCSPATDFHGFTNEEKFNCEPFICIDAIRRSIWATFCNAEWPPRDVRLRDSDLETKKIMKHIEMHSKETLHRDGPINSYTGLIVVN